MSDAHCTAILLRQCRKTHPACGITAMIWTGIVFKFLGDVHQDRDEAERTNRNFAMVFEENVLRSIGEIDKALLYMRRTVEVRKDTTDFNTIVSTTDVLSEIIVQV